MKIDLIRGDYLCDCKHIFPGNAVHFLCNWMLKNELVFEQDFITFRELKCPSALICDAGRLTRTTDLCYFFEVSNKSNFTKL